MSQRCKIMGILNVTPDSFSDGGRYDSLELAVRQAQRLMEQGADILDIGGESTRPGAEEIDVLEEIRRTVPVIAAIREATRDAEIGPVISIDTRKPEVAEAAIHAGADIWNDVTALTFSDRSEATASDLACPVIIMHMQGSPETMQHSPRYDDAVRDVRDYLAKRLDALEFAGIERARVTIDPGLGFGKRQEDNLAILRELAVFQDLGCPVLMGASRKSFIGRIDGSSADDRLGGSLAAALWSLQAGADILRVHDVAETVQAVKVWEAINRG
ncbi:dihydropteroate synthase [Litorimonas sp. RW-G-Af-16]|uniref:dihydropteroate synthase n=1 Tax=Litorimonas sp. RW-G-Af-16 TaxID=3241168 RepID=UPI00390CD596